MKQLVHTANPHEKALVVAVIKKGGNRIEALEYLDELAFLAETAGAEVIGKIYQERVRPDRATMIGKGKVAEIKEMIELSERHIKKYGFRKMSLKELDGLTKKRFR